MKKTFKLLLISTLSLFVIEGCTTEKEKIIRPTDNPDRFRTLNASKNNEDIKVVCTNCSAKFKISPHAMKSGAIIKCPVCKHHYRTGQH